MNPLKSRKGSIFYILGISVQRKTIIFGVDMAMNSSCASGETRWFKTSMRGSGIGAWKNIRVGTPHFFKLLGCC